MSTEGTDDMTATTAPTPQVEADLLRAIKSGHYRPGEALPAIASLADEFNVNKNTVSRAVQRLKAAGVLSGSRGGYTRVSTEPARLVRMQPARYRTEKQRALLGSEARASYGATEMDTGTETDDLRFHADYSDQPADQESATILGVRPGTLLLARTYRTRDKTGRLVGRSQSLIPRDLIEGNPDLLSAENEPWPGGTFHQFRTVGIEIAHITDHITTRPPHPDEAADLAVPEGVAVFAVRKVSYATTGRAVEIATFVLPGNTTELVYEIELPKWSSNHE